MKKVFYYIILITSLIYGLTSCEIDNFPQPDAQVYGAIRDSVGGELVEQDMVTGSVIGTYELGGYDNPVLRTWAIMTTGEYRNNLVYSNTYKIEFTSCNFFPYTIDEVTFKPGPNEQDFLVTPFIRVKNCTIVREGNLVKASFNLEAGKPTVKVSKISLYVFMDKFVGEYVKSTVATGIGKPSQSFSPAATINPATVYNLSIDLAANKTSVFAVSRNYYFRVGVNANQAGVGTIRANYAPYVKIPITNE
ncbi:MAG TPA: DUF3823 domain-containing protein [Bacteroidales bacterium]|jgi:hypothetical protein|nr:DUF3823 domain-containing protein [Bacteroidales bacterium]